MNVTAVNNFITAYDQRSGATQKRTSSQSQNGFANEALQASKLQEDNIELLASGNGLDFTKMTRSELIRAAQQLRSEGKLSGDQAGLLQGFACAYAAAPGELLSPQYSLTDPTKYDFFDMIREASNSDRAHGQTLAAANDDALLRALSQYVRR